MEYGGMRVSYSIALILLLQGFPLLPVYGQEKESVQIQIYTHKACLVDGQRLISTVCRHRRKIRTPHFLFV